MRFSAMSMVSWGGIFVKRLVTSLETRNFGERFPYLNWKTKEKSIFASVIIRS